MVNKKRFRSNLYARVHIRPLCYYADLNKYLDEEWLVERTDSEWFRINNSVNGFSVVVGYDVVREWVDDFSKHDGVKRGTVILKAQIILRGLNASVEPLTDSLLTEAMKRTPDHR